MYQNYIFDLYGTLIDIHTDETQKRLWKVMTLLYARNGAEYTEEELKEAYAGLCREETEKAKEKSGSDYPEPDLGNVFRRLYEEAPKKHPTERGITKDLVAYTADAFRTLSMKRIRPFAHAREVLDRLREDGKKVYLLSNAQHLFTVPELELTGLADAFDAVYISSDAGIKKPEPRYMELLLEEQHLDPGGCLMIGNELNTDMEIAARCGIRGVFLNTYRVPLQDVKDWEAGMEQLGVHPDIQMVMSGDIRQVLRL